jgi:hypothetical protein
MGVFDPSDGSFFYAYGLGGNYIRRGKGVCCPVAEVVAIDEVDVFCCLDRRSPKVFVTLENTQR